MRVGPFGELICLGYSQVPTGAQRIRELGYRERIPGGRAEGFIPSDFNRRQLMVGTRVELEHTPSRRMAQEIAMDHLIEDPDYYRKLATIHLDGAQLGDFRSDFINTMGIVMGREKATKFISDFEALVEQRAAAGAEAKVKPLVIRSMVLGGLGLALGLTGVVLAMRR